MKKVIVLLFAAAMLLSLAACGKTVQTPEADPLEELTELVEQEEAEAQPAPAVQNEAAEEETEPAQTDEEELPAPSEEEASPAPENDSTSEEIRPDFKAAMDSYEAYYDEYCAFMKKYQENPSDLSLLAEYAEMLKRMSEMDEAFEKWENEDLNDAELAYYLEVNNRVTQKLLAVA